MSRKGIVVRISSLRSFLASLLASLLILLGLITIWLPIPTGLPLLMVGVQLLMRYSPHGRVWVLKIASVSPTVHRYLSKIRFKDEAKALH